MKNVTVSIRGIRPLILHNGRTANPLDKFSKAIKVISAKRKKSDKDFEEMAALEWEAGIYWSDRIGLYLPIDNVQRGFLDACKKLRMGRDSIAFLCDEPLGYQIKTKNHKSFEKMKADPDYRFTKAVKVSTAKVVRTRPIIPPGWEMKITGHLDTELMNPDNFEEIWHIAGERIGFGDWRPGAPSVPGSYGRFEVLEVS